MKKPLIVLGAIAVAAIIGAPYVTGMVAESGTRDLVSKLNQSPSEFGTTEVISYDRSVYSSKSHFSYQPPTILKVFLDNAKVEYTCDQSHGITGIDYTCQIVNNESYSTFITEKLGGKDPISVFGSVSAFGGLSQTIEVSEIAGFEEGDTEINLSKTVFTIDTNSALDSFDINGGSDGFTINDTRKSETVSLGKFKLNGDVSKSNSGLFVGDMSMSLDSVSTNRSSGNMLLSDFALETSTSESGENTQSTGTFSIAKIEGTNSPFKSVEDIEMNIDISGLNTQALVEYQEFAKNMQSQVLSSLESNTEPSMNPADAMAIVPIIEKMLVAGLKLDLDLSGNVDGDTSSFKLSIKLLDSLGMGDMMTLAFSPEETLKKIDLTLETNLGKKLIDSQPMAAATVGVSPLVSADDDSYNVDLKLGKEISLNGKTMSFQELQQLVMSSAM